MMTPGYVISGWIQCKPQADCHYLIRQSISESMGILDSIKTSMTCILSWGTSNSTRYEYQLHVEHETKVWKPFSCSICIYIYKTVILIWYKISGVGLEDQPTCRMTAAFCQEILVHFFVKQWFRQMFLALDHKRTMADWKSGKAKSMNFNKVDETE